MMTWSAILETGCTPKLRGPERNSVMMVNGLSFIMIVVVSFFLIFYIATGVNIWSYWLPAYPLYLLPILLNRKHEFQWSRLLFFWGSLLLIGTWCFTNRRNGAEYGLIVLGITTTLIFKRNAVVYATSAASALILIVYKVYDATTEFVPNPTFNYELTPKLIFWTAISIAFLEILIFRSLANRYYKKLNKKYNELQTSSNSRRLVEAELQVANEELLAANESLNSLTQQLDWVVQQKSIELQSYLDAIDIHLYSAVTDVKGKIVKVNDPLLRVAGYSRAELLGANFRILNSGHHQRELFKNLYTCILSGKTWRGEIRNRAKDGTLFWIDQVILPVKNEKGELTYFLMLALPITERKEMENERFKTMQMLESVAYRTSHEVRAPLARILGLTYLLSHGMIKPEEFDQITNQIAISSKELDEATRDLTMFVTKHHFQATAY